MNIDAAVKFRHRLAGGARYQHDELPGTPRLSMTASEEGSVSLLLRPSSLGPSVLRAETAAIAALAVVAHALS